MVIFRVGSMNNDYKLIMTFAEGRFEYTFYGYASDDDDADSGELLLITAEDILRIFKRNCQEISRTKDNFEKFLDNRGVVRKPRKLKATKPKPQTKRPQCAT